MTAPGMVPRPDTSLVGRMAKIESRLRVTQQAAARTPSSSGWFSRYQSSTASVTTSPALMTWGSPVEGAGNGLTLSAATTFTLSAGIWRVCLSLAAGAATTGVTVQLADNAVYGSIGNFYAQENAGVVNGVASLSIAAEIRSTGAAILAAYVEGAAAGSVTTANGLPRLTFNWSPL